MSERTIRLVGTSARLAVGWGGWFVYCGKVGRGPYPTLCAAWNALHIAYAEKELA